MEGNQGCTSPSGKTFSTLTEIERLQQIILRFDKPTGLFIIGAIQGRRLFMEQPLIQPKPPSSVISFGEWFLTLFLTAIPLVGIVLLFVWAFSSTTNPSKANWAKAGLAWAAIAIVIYLLIFVVIMGIMGTASRY
jgi:hypothetical protein